MTTQAGVALSEASPQRKPRPQRLRECHAVGAPAQARYPPGAKVVISAPLSRGSLFWLAGRRNHRPQCPHRKSPPLPKCREGLPLRAPLRDPGQGGKPTGEYPKLPYAAPRGRGILPRLPSVEFPPAPPEARPPANWQTSTPAKSPASKPQWRPGPIMLPACHPPANRPLSKAPAPSPPLPPVVPADTPLPRGQHAIPSLPWPLNQLASILAAQIRARGPSSGFPLQAPGAAGSIDGEV
ncbi:hypothetical protein N7447_011237 [Penicillium robsamsonii]|uniref:uncharacterized protein n=1 Tax=Penicillium robsamsonii TaxID=1792511 RepID=UPI0025466821|nr:uncharacterized protein N7447_011316 [Penicillium robsamsonii]XP_057080314.1 uncharacterized protein N7447_011237 [Penicillium robsamsonii]KAJ5807189.1 hypothetical protein N7447_011316 [Penicillium robsamsonii]KAJ5807225.1 hypothetical protein N7447_011237 [Penicillium robsamsonii]